jgi:hypothetical protein
MFSARRRAGGKQPEKTGKLICIVPLIRLQKKDEDIVVAGGLQQAVTIRVAEECSTD